MNAAGYSWQTVSKVDVHLGLRVQEIAQDAILQDETDTQEITRIRAGSNKISDRIDLKFVNVFRTPTHTLTHTHGQPHTLKF